MKNYLFIFLVFIGFLICNVNAVNNSKVTFHSLNQEDYALMLCDISGTCVYHNQTDYIELNYNQDWIIKIIPKNYSINKLGEDVLDNNSFGRISILVSSLLFLYIMFRLYKVPINILK
jgi:hypothetical protein